ncbi:hypothetical protein C3L33_20110, partial [Rhododendron williamsianum]
MGISKAVIASLLVSLLIFHLVEADNEIVIRGDGSGIARTLLQKTVHSQCLENQKSLLLQLKNNLQFNPDFSVKLVNWAQSKDCCQWNGVTCDRSGRVIGLDLNTESISGDLNHSSSLFSLKFLKKLNLAYNNFGYFTQIPSSFGNLTSLTYLNLSNAGFGGQIPMEFLRLTRIVKLDLSGTNLRIENPNLFTLFRNLSGITELYLDRVNISANGYEWGQAISSSLPNLRVLSLSDCSLSGPIDSSLQNLQYLSEINLAWNNLSSLVPDFFANFPNLTVLDPVSIWISHNQFSEVSEFLPNGSLSPLVSLDLSRNKLQGPIPPYFFDFQSLQGLYLSFNNFSGTIQLESFHRFQNLTWLMLSHNSLSVNASISNSSLSSFPQLAALGLASCKLQKFPPLMNQPTWHLDLSNNQIPGVIPNWIWKVIDSDENLAHLNLSCNLLVGLQPGYDIHFLDTLDLHSNQLHDNMLSGPIPLSVCNGRNLQLLDLSNNRFTGTIPQCLIDTGTATLSILNLQNNNLTGNITGTFPKACTLRTLDLSGNHLEGLVPKSLANCPNAEVLNLGINNINGNFPCFLANSSGLRILVLRSNKFHGNIRCRGIHTNIWPKLQIIDLALNNFSGILPQQFFLQRKAMMDGGTSYEGNKGLWGPPLTACCEEAGPAPPTLNGTQSYSAEDEINWVYIIATLGYTVGFGVIVGPLLYSKRWRQCYYKPLDRAIVRILHHREQRARNQRRRNNINQLRRRQHH